MSVKKFVFDFLRRGFIACGVSPLILSILYWILQKTAAVDTLTISQVCVGLCSITILAFIAGGMNAIYQIERLPLMLAILIHGIVLYVIYLGTYLINNWLAFGVIPMVVFSAIFVVGYVVIWMIVYCIIKRKTGKLNEALKKRETNDR